MSNLNFEKFKDRAVDAFGDSSFLSQFSQATNNGSEVFRSKGPSFSMVPLELEMSGLRPSKYIKKSLHIEKRLMRTLF